MDDNTINKTNESTIEDKPLSKQEIIFCELYIKNLCNGYLAYKEWKPNVKDSTARVEPYKLLDKPRIRTYIDKRLDEIAAKNKAFNNEMLLNIQIEELQRMRQGVKKGYWDGVQKKTVEYIEYDNRGINDAIQNLVKMAGLDKPKEVNVKVGPDPVHVELLEALKSVKIEGVDDVDGNSETDTDISSSS